MAKKVSITVDASLVERLQEYRDKTGVPVTHAAEEALRDYLDVVVPARLMAFKPISQSEKKARVVSVGTKKIKRLA